MYDGTDFWAAHEWNDLNKWFVCSVDVTETNQDIADGDTHEWGNKYLWGMKVVTDRGLSPGQWFLFASEKK